jgi:hypothetical protein
VQVAPVRSAAEAAGSALVAALSPFAIDMVLPVLLESLDLKVLWQSKVAAMSLLVALSKQAPEAVKLNLPTIVPVLSYCIADAKRQVKVRCLPDPLFPPFAVMHARLVLSAATIRSCCMLLTFVLLAKGCCSTICLSLQDAAISSMSIVCASVGNRDVGALYLLISALAFPCWPCLHTCSQLHHT